MPTGGVLERRLGVGDAVVIGMGSMIGAGVFAAWAPAAEAAGNGLLLGLALAGLVAFCNATSSAQLAALHPQSGGTYLYGRRQLGPAVGHVAGWGFVVGKSASCAAMALTVGGYLWPDQQRVVGVAAVLAITGINIGGLTRTVAVTRVLLAISLVALAATVTAGWSDPDTDLHRLTPIDASPYGVVRSAGFLFFAFAGYARIATLGEEVRDPATTIPRAIPRALAAVLIVYAVVGVTALAAVDVGALADSDAPLRLVSQSASPLLATMVRVGAAIAALGVLLNLIPGVSRTALAMARNRELPHWFAKVDVQRSLPLRAELTVAMVVIVLVLIADVSNAIAISGIAILTYYAITNASALTLTADERLYPKAIAVIGLVGCVLLIVALPLKAIIVGTATLGFGALLRLATARFDSNTASNQE